MTEEQPGTVIETPEDPHPLESPSQLRHEDPPIFPSTSRHDPQDPNSSKPLAFTTYQTEDGQTRIRRSTRDIKRPKFDDELVDSGIGLHTPSKRRLSERSNSSAPTPVEAIPPFLPILSVDTNIVALPADPSPMETPVQGTSFGDNEDPAESSKRHDLRQRTNMLSVKDRMALDEAIQEEEAARLERKRRESRIASKDIRAKEIAAANEAAEVQSSDLNTWKVEDDIALVTAVTHISDTLAVHRGILFSQDFSVAEIEERWYRLMYDDSFSKQARKRMHELPPVETLRIQSRTVYSAREEEILRTIGANSEPDFSDMAELLRVYPDDFHSARTPQVLLDHWHLMRRSGVLEGAPPPQRTLPEFERLERNTLLTGADPGNEDGLLRMANSLHQMESRLAKVLVESVAGIMNDSQLGDGALATLRGRVVRFVLRKDQLPVTMGRSTPESHADINLALEGPASKVSRIQAKITQEPSGEFWLTNMARKAMFVDGKTVLQDQRVQLVDGSVIEVVYIRLVFRPVHN